MAGIVFYFSCVFDCFGFILGLFSLAKFTPDTEALFLGISPVVTAIILGFCWKLGKKVITNRLGIAIAIITLITILFSQINVLILFIIAGLVNLAVTRFSSSNFYVTFISFQF